MDDVRWLSLSVRPEANLGLRWASRRHKPFVVVVLCCSSSGDRDTNVASSNSTTMHHQSSAHKSSSTNTLALLKSSFIAKVNHHAGAIRRQRSVNNDVTPVCDVTAEGRGSQSGGGGGEIQRRRLRSPFSSARVEPSLKPLALARSSLAEQRIIESVVFRPSALQASAAQVGGMA